MKLALTGSPDTIDSTTRTLEELYEDVGWDYWLDGGAGSQWMKRFEETFFDRKYDPLREKFRSYDKLGWLTDAIDWK